MAAIKLDENVPDSVGATLRQAGHDVHLARDEQLAGVDDEHILSVARSEGRVLVSLDKDFSNVLRHPPEANAGIVVIRLPEQTLPIVRRIATRLADLLRRESPRGQLWIVDRSRIRIWPRRVP